MQATEGFDALIGANRGCYAAFAAVYECPVPVDRRRQRLLPRRRHRPGRQRRRHRRRRRRHLRAARGRPGRAGRRHPPEPPRARSTRCGRWSTRRPPPPPRSCTTSARCTRSCPQAELRDAAFEVAGQIAAKSPTVIRAAKESLNGIDLVGREALVPLRAGLHLRAQPLGRGRRAPRRLRRQARHGHRSTERASRDKRCTEDEAVAELRSGMTIGIGGWGSRRKPMSVVRAILRSRPHRPHRRELRRPRRRPALRRRQGEATRLRLRVARLASRSSPTSGPPARAAPSRTSPTTRACSSSACRRPRGGCPFLPTRVGPRLGHPA